MKTARWILLCISAFVEFLVKGNGPTAWFFVVVAIFGMLLVILAESGKELCYNGGEGWLNFYDEMENIVDY